MQIKAEQLAVYACSSYPGFQEDWRGLCFFNPQSLVTNRRADNLPEVKKDCLLTVIPNTLSSIPPSLLKKQR